MSNEERGCCDAKTCQKENTVVFQFSNIYLSEALKCVDVGHKYSKKFPFYMSVLSGSSFLKLFMSSISEVTKNTLLLGFTSAEIQCGGSTRALPGLNVRSNTFTMHIHILCVYSRYGIMITKTLLQKLYE